MKSHPSLKIEQGLSSGRRQQKSLPDVQYLSLVIVDFWKTRPKLLSNDDKVIDCDTYKVNEKGASLDLDLDNLPRAIAKRKI